MEVQVERDFTHIVAYDNSGSTECCHVEYMDGNVPQKVSYFEFLINQFMPKLQRQYPNAQFKYIAWNSDAKMKEGIDPVSEGGTDPTEGFNLIEEHFLNDKKFIHFLTDGDIYGFTYDKLNILKSDDRMDVHFLGDCNHNIEFYQKVKEMLGDRCNVYINGETVKVYDEIDEGELVMSEEDQMSILTHDFKTSDQQCPAFNKLLATVATHGSNQKYKEAIRKTLAKLVQKSKGSTENEILPDDMPMNEIRQIVSKHKKRIIKSFDAVFSFIMLQMDKNNFNSSALNGNVFLKQLDTNREFGKSCRMKKDQDAKKEDEDEMALEETKEVEEKKKDEKEDLKKENLLCSITLEDIKGPYLLEGVHNEAKKKNDAYEPSHLALMSNINQIRRFPWYILSHITPETFQKSVNVMLTPYTMESFFLLNENKEKSQSIYSSLYNFSQFSYVLLHKETPLGKNDVKIMLNMNYVWACYFFFNRRPSMKQTSIGKKFEVVYVYLFLLQEYFKAKKVPQTYVEDVAFTMETLAGEKESMCKMPQFSIYYSLNLHKRILTESKFLEPKSNPLATMVVRQRMGLESTQKFDNMTLFVACLQWWNTGKCPEDFKKHRLLDEKIFEDIMKFPAPSNKSSAKVIFRSLLQSFVKTVQIGSEKLFINEVLPEEETYFNDVPINFIKFLIISLNYQKLPFNKFIPSKRGKKVMSRRRIVPKKAGKKGIRNIDMNLILSYNEYYKYSVNFKRMLYKFPVFESSEIAVCWSTLRPKATFENDQEWSSECKGLKQEWDHKKRLEKCDSQHLSLHKNYLNCYRAQSKTVTKEDLFKYLVKNFPLKTFQPNILSDIENVVNVYSEIVNDQYKGDAKAVEEVISKTWNLAERKNFEKDCKVSKCFHAK